MESEIVRKSIVDYAIKMETVKNGVVSSEKLAFMLREANMDVSSVDLKKAVEFYEKAKKLE